MGPPLWLCWLKCLSPMQKDERWNPSHDRPKSYKQVVTAPLPNIWQMGVSVTGLQR